MSVSYQILYWRDIPAQVRVREGGQRVARPLSDRFQQAIDEAAMRAGATSTDEYLDDWRTTEWQAGDGELDTLAEQLVVELEAAYPAERLHTLKLKEGYE